MVLEVGWFPRSFPEVYQIWMVSLYMIRIATIGNIALLTLLTNDLNFSGLKFDASILPPLFDLWTSGIRTNLDTS
jgi:hypothetical protein